MLLRETIIRKTIKIFYLTFLSSFLSLVFAQTHVLSEEMNIRLSQILNKKTLTLLITDSGLGGMSVCAGLEKELEENKSFEEVKLIFFNALPEKGIGYNSMATIEMKAEVFNQALISMEKKYTPDLILVACNTLSVVYPYTNFAKESKTPVLGIVEFGVELMLAELKKHNNSDVLILGTETTVNSNTHKNKLIENKINSNQIIAQAFPGLESEIQDAPESETVKAMIELYLIEAVEKLNKTSEPIIATLCCTHYGFCSDIFSSTLQNLSDREIVLLNPNEMMINTIVKKEIHNRFPKTRVSVSVISRAIIDESEKQSIGGLVKSFAPLSALALMNYVYDPQLFDYGG